MSCEDPVRVAAANLYDLLCDLVRADEPLIELGANGDLASGMLVQAMNELGESLGRIPATPLDHRAPV